MCVLVWTTNESGGKRLARGEAKVANWAEKRASPFWKKMALWENVYVGMDNVVIGRYVVDLSRGKNRILGLKTSAVRTLKKMAQRGKCVCVFVGTT